MEGCYKDAIVGLADGGMSNREISRVMSERLRRPISHKKVATVLKNSVPRDKLAEYRPRLTDPAKYEDIVKLMNGSYEDDAGITTSEMVNLIYDETKEKVSPFQK